MILPRFFKRLEDLLSRAVPESNCTDPERDTALREALRLVKRIRAGKPEDEWHRAVALQFGTCAICDDPIKPAQKIYKSETSAQHMECWLEHVETT